MSTTTFARPEGSLVWVGDDSPTVDYTHHTTRGEYGPNSIPKGRHHRPDVGTPYPELAALEYTTPEPYPPAPADPSDLPVPVLGHEGHPVPKGGLRGFLVRLARKVRVGWGEDDKTRSWEVTFVSALGEQHAIMVGAVGPDHAVSLAMGKMVRECAMWSQFHWYILRVEMKYPIPGAPLPIGVEPL